MTRADNSISIEIWTDKRWLDLFSRRSNSILRTTMTNKQIYWKFLRRYSIIVTWWKSQVRLFLLTVNSNWIGSNACRPSKTTSTRVVKTFFVNKRKTLQLKLSFSFLFNEKSNEQWIFNELMHAHVFFHHWTVKHSFNNSNFDRRLFEFKWFVHYRSDDSNFCFLISFE